MVIFLLLIDIGVWRLSWFCVLINKNVDWMRLVVGIWVWLCVCCLWNCIELDEIWFKLLLFFEFVGSVFYCCCVEYGWVFDEFDYLVGWL